jgi:uncharacterized cupin superfamily protein
MPQEASAQAIEAITAPEARPGRGYPEPFASRVAGRVRRPLGDLFGLTNFGVNLTRLPPGGLSALRHTHTPIPARTSLSTSSKASRCW